MYFAKVCSLRGKQDPPPITGRYLGGLRNSTYRAAGISEGSGKSIQKSHGSPKENGKGESAFVSQRHPCLRPSMIQKGLFCPPRGPSLLEAGGGGIGEATSALCPLCNSHRTRVKVTAGAKSKEALGVGSGKCTGAPKNPTQQIKILTCPAPQKPPPSPSSFLFPKLATTPTFNTVVGGSLVPDWNVVFIS